MMNFLTVYKSGVAFTKDYVINLRRGVMQNITADHRFVCLSDTVDRAKYDSESDIHWEPLKHGWPRHWSKAEMFRPDLEKYGRFLFIDLSSVIVGSLDEMAAVEGVCVTKDFQYDCPSQSILMFPAGSCRDVWEKFIADPDRWIAEGSKMEPPNFHDQILMSDMDLPYWQDILPGQVVSFKKDCAEGVPDAARIVKFHGKPKPHDIESGWVKDVWEGRISRIDFVPKSNVSDDVSLAHMRVNNARGLPWVEQVKHRVQNDLVIVGGGPSIKENLGRIRHKALSGAHIWTLNGTHDYLIDNGIIPDALVMLDSREGNVNFVKKPHKDVTYYIAARCHPKVMTALDGYDVCLWHSVIDGEKDVQLMKGRGILIGGGSTVGLRAMYLAWVALGYWKFHLYGFDSSYRGDENHAYEQAMNSGDVAMPVYVKDRKFMATPWMANQATGFKEQCGQMTPKGCEISVYGDGLLPYVAQLLTD